MWNIFQRDLETVKDVAESLHSLDFSDNTVNKQLELEYEFKLYTDIQREYGIDQQSLALLCTFVQKGPRQIGADIGSKGYPITYTLLPTDMFAFGTPTVPNFVQRHGVTDDIHMVLDLFDRLNEYGQKLDEYRLFIQAKKHYIPITHVNDVDDAIVRISGERDNLKFVFKNRVLETRDGLGGGRQVHDLYAAAGSALEQISNIAGQQSDKIDFIHKAVSSGAS